MASILRFYKSYTIKRALAQVAGTPIAGTGTATNKITATAHGLAEGDTVVPSAHATLTLTDLARYYVKYVDANSIQLALTKGGSAVAIGDSGSVTLVPIDTIELDWANKIAANSERDNYDWAGSNQKTHIELLARLSLTIDLDCIPAEAHALIYDKATITDTLVNGMTPATAVGYGGGADVQGAQVGLVLEGYALKGASETPVEFSLWYMSGLLTLSAAPGLTSGAVADKQQYLFSASKGNTDVAGGTVAGLSDDGEYYIFAESA